MTRTLRTPAASGSKGPACPSIVAALIGADMSRGPGHMTNDPEAPARVDARDLGGPVTTCPAAPEREAGSTRPRPFTMDHAN